MICTKTTYSTMLQLRNNLRKISQLQHCQVCYFRVRSHLTHTVQCTVHTLHGTNWIYTKDNPYWPKWLGLSDSYNFPYWLKGHRLLLPVLAQRTQNPTPLTSPKDINSYSPDGPQGHRLLLPVLAHRKPNPTPQTGPKDTDSYSPKILHNHRREVMYTTQI